MTRVWAFTTQPCHVCQCHIQLANAHLTLGLTSESPLPRGYRDTDMLTPFTINHHQRIIECEHAHMHVGIPISMHHNLSLWTQQTHSV